MVASKMTLKLSWKSMRRLSAGLVICLHFVLIKYQMLLEKLSTLITKHPRKIIVIMVLITALSCLGFLTMTPPNLQEDFWVSEDSRLMKDLKAAEQYFPLFRSRHQEVIVRPMANNMQGNNVLSSACLKDALLVHKTVVTLNNFQKVCMEARNKGQLKNNSCMMTNPLEVCDLNDDKYEHCLEAIAQEWKEHSGRSLSDGRTFKFNQELFIKDLKQDNSSAEKGNISARAMRMIYYLKNPSEGDPARKDILSWEGTFVQKMEELRSRMTCASLFFTSSQNHDNVAAVLFSIESPPIFITFAVLFCTSVILVNATLASFRTVAFILGCLMAVCVAMGVVSSVGLSYLAFVEIWQSIWVITIFMYCKGALDALVLIKEMHKQRHMPSVEIRIANCMAKSGMALTTSNLISIVMFGFAYMSSFPVFRGFALVALINVLYHYLIFFILFMACLFCWLKQYKYDKHVDDSFVVDTDLTKDENASPSSPTECCPLMQIYGKIIGGKLGSAVILMLFIGIVACSSYLVLSPANQVFDSPLKISPETEPAKFMIEKRKLFESEKRVKIVFYSKLDYSNSSLRQQLQMFGETLSVASYSKRPVDSWINHFEKWVERENFTYCRGPQFETCLVKFLKDPKNAFVHEDLNFTIQNDTLNLVASSFHLYMIPSEEFLVKKRYLKSLKSDIMDFEKKQHIPVSIVSHLLDETEQLIRVEKECIWFATMVGIATITILSLILTANIRIAGALAIGFVVQVLELLALLNLWDIPLNCASIICLALGFIISMNFSVQMGQVRALSVDNTVRKRTLDALNSVGTAILCGGMLAILGSIGLGFVFPNLSLIFFRVLPIHFALGVFHALGYMPSTILLTSKPMEACARAIAPSFEQSQEVVELREHKKLKQETFCKDSLQKSRPSGVAVLGISCRFPNAENKEAFWDMLTKGKSGFQEDYPANRPSEQSDYHMLYNPKRFTPGRLCALGGSYLNNIRDFDAEFFNISPQEAKAMDPQQRIILQIAFEAIEDAGLRLEDLQKGKAGVFVGAMNLDYSSRVMQPENRNNLNQFYSTGVTASILANRISFCLNLTGPSLTVDTACSSSLVALKIASDCLRNGECDVAIVCAPNIILDPSVQIIFSVGGLLAPDGRCKSFDASGDGYGRGEGFVAVVLKLTDDAVMDKDDIYCEIISCGMNNDGQSAVPITAPSAKTQADLSQKVLEESGLDAEDIEYLEAHGTGTAIGDVVEIKSIAKTYSSNASGNGRILRVGSVKSNLNHTESASGLAGLIKVALMLKTKTLVPTININTLNPKLKLAEKGIKVQDVCEPWTKPGGNPRTAALNSFGYGGSNVHAILQEHPEMPKKEGMPKEECLRKNHVLTLSAHSETALHDMAKRHAKWLKDNFYPEEAKNDICWSLNTRRSQHSHRLAVVFESLQGAANLLELFGEGNTGWEDCVSQGKAMSQHSRAVFVFGGQGANWNGMGRQLMDSEPLFRQTISEISSMIQDLGEQWSLKNELLCQESTSSLMGNITGQLATFALQYATAKLLQSWGIIPAAVVGHSLGELAACCVAGALSLEEALRIILIRSRCHEHCPMDGSMAALGMSEEDASQLIIQLRLENSINIAAINDENSVTISGDKLSIECVQNHLQLNSIQVFWRKLSTARAFHSFQVEMVKDYFQSQMKSLHLQPQTTTIPIYSTVTGDLISGKTLDENYWWCNFRQPVQFCKAVQNILRDNYKILIEISAQPSLGHYIQRVSEQKSHSTQTTSVVYVPTHPRKSVRDQHKAFLHNTVGRLYTVGYHVDWDCVQGDESNAHFIRTPTYPWQKKDYWYVQDELTKPEEKDHFHRHAFLTNVKPTEHFTGLQCWEVEIDLYQFPTLRDHALTQGGPVLPGSACIEMAIAMTVEKFCCDEVEIKNVQFTSILTIPENQIRLIRLQLQDGKDIGTAEFQVKNIPGDGSEILLARGEVAAVLGEGKMRKIPEKGSFRSGQAINDAGNFKDITSRMETVALTEFRHLTEKFGFNFGPSFSLIKSIWRGREEAFCIIEIEREEVKTEMARYIAHPAFLDACFQTSAAVEEDSDDKETSTLPVPVRIKRLLLSDRNIPQRTFCHVSKQSHGNWVTYDINVMDSQGTILLAVEGFQSTEISTLIRSQKLDNMAYETTWVECAIEPQLNTEPDVRIVLNDSKGFGQFFCNQLKMKFPAAHVISVDVPSMTEHLQEALKREISLAISSVATPARNVQLLNFLPVDAGLLPESYEELDKSQMLSFVSSVQILQAITSSNLKSPHLVIVTRNSQVVTSDTETCCFPWASSVLGLRRTASLEYANIRCTTVDLSDDAADLVLLAQEVQAASQEDEIAFRGGKRFVNRVNWMDKSSSHTKASCKGDTLPSVHITLHPKTGDICFKKNTWPSLSSKQIRVNVTCTSIVNGNINKLLSDSQVVSFSGQVCQAATGKAGIQIGDEVCGMASISKVGNQVQVNADHVIHKPKGMSDPQAANLPVCMAFALHAIRKTLGEQQNLCILIDDTKSGLGAVTILVAKALGHIILDDAAKKHTRPGMVSSLGMMSEKSVDQVSEIDAAIYFHQPKPKSLQATCQLLKEGGKLVILKEDVKGSITIPTGKQITCERISSTEILQSPNTFSELWTSALQLMQSAGFMDQLLEITQHTVNAFQKVEEAKGESQQIMFDYSKMKSPAFVSLSFSQNEKWSDHSVNVLMPGINQKGLKPDRTYVVVGGIRGFGFEVARWMADSGAKSIVLVARSTPTESKLSEVSQLIELTGANIILHQADASSSISMKGLEQRLKSLPSVAGIVHTAMVLRDELIPNLTTANFREVAAPKIKGAFLLHEMSLNMDLDFFVLFSSIASLLGNPGQASYAAANAFLDGLAQYRRHVLGLPAVSINWGPIKGVGVLQREEAIAQHLTRAGYFLLPSAQAIQYMEKVLIEEPGRAQLGLFDVDWQTILNSTPGLAKSTRLAYISKEQDSTDNVQDKQQIASRLLMEKDQQKQAELVHQYVTDLLCSWTGNAPSDLDFNSSLYNYGMDSFSGLTFKMQMESAIHISFEVFYFCQPDTTPARLVHDIIGRLRNETNSPVQDEEVVHSEETALKAELPLLDDSTQSTNTSKETAHPIDKASPTATYHLIPLFKPEQAEVKLFCVHPAGRYTMNLAPISNGFTQQSLVAFYGIGYTEPTMKAENRSVRKIAQSYTRMIKEVQRHGPYYLAGQSFGGLVAYEIASILTEQCEDVAFVAMIDTFPWYLPNRTGAARLELLFSGTKLDKLMDGLFEATFEQVLSKLAVTNLKMTADEYKALRERETLGNTMALLQQKATAENIPLYDLTLLQNSLRHDNKIATQKHREWKPPQVRFKGPLTYLKSADQRYTPTRPLQEDSDASWSLMVDGNIDVYICPGDHLALSDPEDGAVVGGILSTAVGMRYRTLCPSLPRLPTTFKERRAIHKFEAGVNVLLYSRKVTKPSQMGTMFLDVTNQTLTFKSTPRRSENANRKSKERKISIKGLRNILPGNHEPSAIKIASKMQETTEQRTAINLTLVTSVVTPKRAYNFEWNNFKDMREFCSVMEAIMGVTIFKK